MLSSAQARPIRAFSAILAVIVSFCVVVALCRIARAQPAPAILAAILAIGLSRRPLEHRGASLLLTPVVLAATALVAGGVGWLLLTVPPAGALVFIAGIALSIVLRNFGARAQRAGSFIALPLVTMLIAPARAQAPGGPLVDLALIVAAGLVPLASVALLRALLARTPLAIVVVPASRAFAPPERAKRAGLSAPTRMAVQMTVALGLAFAAGFALFPQHWGWTVLTAFIVCSGARGRGDAAHKGILRLAGAVVGTVAAAAVTHLWLPSGPLEAVAIFAVLYVGIWLREVNYAYWAACMTLVLALLSRPSGAIDLALLATRLEAIAIGALCGVAAAWFVLPIRTEAVVRRRLADALAALDEVFATDRAALAERTAKLELFEHRLSELASVAAPVRWHRRVFVRGAPPSHPATWIDLAVRLRHRARAVGSQTDAFDERRAAVRGAIRTSRRAIAAHGAAEAPPGVPPLGIALQALHDTLHQSTA